MTLDVHLFPCRSDNYGFLIRDTATGVVAAVDTPDAERILQELEALGWGRLDLILNTHWHPDHTEGNERLKAETGCEIVGPEEVRRVAPLDRVVADGDEVMVGEHLRKLRLVEVFLAVALSRAQPCVLRNDMRNVAVPLLVE